jgi:TolB-like protein
LRICQTIPEQEYFADAITEDLTTDLSRIANSFVIARSTAFNNLCAETHLLT